MYGNPPQIIADAIQTWLFRQCFLNTLSSLEMSLGVLRNGVIPAIGFKTDRRGSDSEGLFQVRQHQRLERFIGQGDRFTVVGAPHKNGEGYMIFRCSLWKKRACINATENPHVFVPGNQKTKSLGWSFWKGGRGQA